MVAYGRKYFWAAVHHVTMSSRSVAGKKPALDYRFLKVGQKETSALASLLPVC